MDATVAARAEGVDFLSSGDGFTLRIYREDRIALTWGDQELSFPKPDPILPRWNGEIYETQNGAHTLRVEIRRSPCDLGGQPMPTRVRAILDHETREGCGRSL